MCRLYEGAVASRALDGATGPVDNGRMGYRDRQFWQPDVTVATVVVREGKLLCVEERVNGQAVINQPAGHLEPDESLVDAAIRPIRVAAERPAHVRGRAIPVITESNVEAR